MCFECAEDQYAFMERMVRLYSRLQDEQSKRIFWVRLQFEAEPGMDQALKLWKDGQMDPSHALHKEDWKETFLKTADAGKKIILYGAGMNGRILAELIQNSHMDFYAFCDKNKSGQSMIGKQVLSPEEIIHHPEIYAVIIATSEYYDEVLHDLLENRFPMESILPCFEQINRENSVIQYREFPELFQRGTAIVDAGCYDGFDSIHFAKWCNGAYSRIYAFEPDEKNYSRCREAIHSAEVANVVLYQAGLSSSSGEGDFVSNLNGSSHLSDTGRSCYIGHSENENTIVSIYALDDIADMEVGMIKMDIEGAELNALRGARKTIQRDKPQLAICVYHRRGDMLAIMEYLNKLVPEYRFWLRHYGALGDDTILYAAI